MARKKIKRLNMNSVFFHVNQTLLKQLPWFNQWFSLALARGVGVYSHELPRLGKRELVFLLLFTCSFVVSVLGRFLFLLVLGMDCAFLLWHSLGLPLIIQKLFCSCFFLSYFHLPSFSLPCWSSRAKTSKNDNLYYIQ